MLGRNTCLFICRTIALFVVVSCAPNSKTKAAEPANTRPTDAGATPQSPPTKNPTYPTSKKRRQATQLRMFSGQALAIWNAQFLAEGKWDGTKPDFALNTSFATSGTVDVFIKETGERIQWLRQDEAVEDGWIARDQLVF